MSETSFKRGDKVWIANLLRGEIVEATILQKDELCELPSYFLESADGDSFIDLEIHLFTERSEAEKCLVNTILERIEACVKFIRKDFCQSGNVMSVKLCRNVSMSKGVAMLEKIASKQEAERRYWIVDLRGKTARLNFGKKQRSAK